MKSRHVRARGSENSALTVRGFRSRHLIGWVELSQGFASNFTLSPRNNQQDGIYTFTRRRIQTAGLDFTDVREMTSLDGSFPPPLLPPALREGGEDLYGRRRQEHASTGLGAAAVRGISARVFGFWFRAPVRSFVRTRIE